MKLHFNFHITTYACEVSPLHMHDNLFWPTCITELFVVRSSYMYIFDCVSCMVLKNVQSCPTRKNSCELIKDQWVLTTFKDSVVHVCFPVVMRNNSIVHTSDWNISCYFLQVKALQGKVSQFSVKSDECVYKGNTYKNRNHWRDGDCRSCYCQVKFRERIEFHEKFNEK